ncbi:MAG TPA: cytidine deaminase [Gammaproteobacteria bacterium]|jgi:cytidine deaminase|nr:cytidine deaminase [Gammaproteobacteria bacterium]HAY41281.1 cytidine deaminase [Gammaproteobacteria bacterium]|tara:strand:- start:272 stop:667 length:396 start_codon:yes stop_codon:yes gene_type:complete
MSDSEHIDLLRNAMQNAYAPYSNYKVGALIISENGAKHVGCNVENASYPQGQCAESSAISAMIVSGDKYIKQIYIMSEDKAGATPCGGCRQRIREFSDSDTLIKLCSSDKTVKTLSISDLLPHSFGPENLK